MGASMPDNDEVDPMRAAVRDGFRDIVSDPETYRNIKQGLTAYAKSEAGDWTIGVVGSVLRWILRGVLLLILLYYVGGLPALFAYFKTRATNG
jgi:hypothetical protein